MSGSSASSPTPCRSTPIAAPAGRRPPIAIERLVDVAARQLGVAAGRAAPAQFRQARGRCPTTPRSASTTTAAISSATWTRRCATADHAGFAARRAAARSRGKLRGFGIAVYIEQCGFRPTRFAELRFDPSGTVTLLIGTQSSGQGHQTAYAQLVAERLGIALEQIRVPQGDTRRRRLRPRHRRLALAAGRRRAVGARRRQADRQGQEDRRAPSRGGRGRHRVRRRRLLDRRHRPQRRLRRRSRTPPSSPRQLPPGMEAGFDESGAFHAAAPTFPNGCHVCEVEIDPETGTIAHPALSRGRRFRHGDQSAAARRPGPGRRRPGRRPGAARATASTMPESGQLVTGSLIDYCMPRADDLPPISSSPTTSCRAAPTRSASRAPARPVRSARRRR